MLDSLKTDRGRLSLDLRLAAEIRQHQAPARLQDAVDLLEPLALERVVRDDGERRAC